MKIFKKLDKWGNTQAFYPIDILLFCLGVFLFYQGFLFVQNSDFFIELFKEMNFDDFSSLM